MTNCEYFLHFLPKKKVPQQKALLPLLEWEDLEASGDHYRWEEEWRLSLDLKKLRAEMIESLSCEFIRQSRMQFLEGYLTWLNMCLQTLENIEVAPRYLFWHYAPQNASCDRQGAFQNCADLKKTYKRAYIEYGELRGDLKLPKKETSPQVIEECRAVPLEDLVGVPVVALGGRQKCLCPFHSEKTPSFVIYPDNSAFCFGCGAHLNNAIDYVIKKDGKSFLEAVEYLKGFC